jgi:Family of unknown function (DUF6516)
MIKALLVHRSKISYPDGAIREMVVWQLPVPSANRPHGVKYRFYYGLPDGTCLIRYDNEAGKGDHRHSIVQEESYNFISLDQLFEDFFADIAKLRERNKA